MINSGRQLRACLYARYSTDRQRDSSIEDQLRAARALAIENNWRVVAQHQDEAVSGSTPVASRPGGKLLLADALAGHFEILILEGLDRLSREMGEQEILVKRLEHCGIRIIGTADNYDSSRSGRKVMRIARGLVNELYLDDLREKTHRGQAGQFDRKRHVGGTCYGYESYAAPSGEGSILQINEIAAGVVRQIFIDYAAGASARTIVHQLNRDRVPSPRGGTWAVSALVGDRKRGAGLLNNTTYIGQIRWNRRQWLKDPATGKRRPTERPRHEWLERNDESLRIVPQDVWEAVRARDRQRPTARKGAPMKSLFAGILKCASCGGPLTAIDARRYGCNIKNDRGTCDTTHAFRRKDVDDTLLAYVRDELLAPEVLPLILEASERALVPDNRATAQALEKRLVSLKRDTDRLVDAIVQHGANAAIKARLDQLQWDHDAVTLELSTVRSSPSVTPQQIVEAFKVKVRDLRHLIDDKDSDRNRFRELLAEMLGPVRLTRDGQGSWAEMEEPAQRVALAGSSVPTNMVARARFELATFGL